MVTIDRPRPPAQDWVRHASGESFPSGHTTTAALGYGLLLLLLSPSVRSVAGRALLAVGLLGVAAGGLIVLTNSKTILEALGATTPVVATTCAVLAVVWVTGIVWAVRQERRSAVEQPREDVLVEA